MSATFDDAMALYNEDKFEEAYAIFYDLGIYGRNSEALFYLGLMHQYGEGVEVSIDKAVEFWKKATQMGHTEAAFRMNEYVTSTRHTSK